MIFYIKYRLTISEAPEMASGVPSVSTVFAHNFTEITAGKKFLNWHCVHHPMAYHAKLVTSLDPNSEVLIQNNVQHQDKKNI